MLLLLLLLMLMLIRRRYFDFEFVVFTRLGFFHGHVHFGQVFDRFVLNIRYEVIVVVVVIVVMMRRTRRRCWCGCDYWHIGLVGYFKQLCCLFRRIGHGHVVVVGVGLFST